MGHLTWGYKMDPSGKRVMHARFDSDQIPADWFDSPEKCLAAAGVQEAPKPDPTIISPEPVFIAPARRPGRPRKAA